MLIVKRQGKARRCDALSGGLNIENYETHVDVVGWWRFNFNRILVSSLPFLISHDADLWRRDIM